MKKKLLNAKNNVLFADIVESLKNEDLQFITGGNTSISGGAGTSSTSGSTCCDGTCVCSQWCGSASAGGPNP